MTFQTAEAAGHGRLCGSVQKGGRVVGVAGAVRHTRAGVRRRVGAAVEAGRQVVGQTAAGAALVPQAWCGGRLRFLVLVPAREGLARGFGGAGRRRLPRASVGHVRACSIRRAVTRWPAGRGGSRSSGLPRAVRPLVLPAGAHGLEACLDV
jgi:hypothetical protein